MIITVNVYYKGTEENVKDFVSDMLETGIVSNIRAQEGNLKYEYFIPVDRKGEVLLIDMWKSQEALDIHHKSSMMNDIIELREKYDLTMEVEKYVQNNDSITELDQKYIKSE